MSEAVNLAYQAIDDDHADESAATRRKFVAGAGVALGGMGLLGLSAGAEDAMAKNDAQTILNVATTAEVLATIVNTVGAERVGLDAVTKLNVQAAARAAGMALGVVHDVAVGVNPAGADAWAYQDAMATSVTVGAPPDAYSQLGQDWRQPPWRPDRLAATGYAPVREMFATALRYCGGLRVDHIIGLFRLWWIPAGGTPAEGTYVHYDHEALLGILVLEAQPDVGGAVRSADDVYPGFVHDTFSAFYPLAAASATIRHPGRPGSARPRHRSRAATARPAAESCSRSPR